MENHHFQWENPLYMVIFNSYVKLPEGKSCLGPRFETLKMDEGPDPGNGWKSQIASL